MYLTFDVGTTSVKTALFDRRGNLIQRVIRDYRLNSPQVGWYEVEPEIYWNSVIEGFREIASKNPGLIKEVKTISGCSQGETVIFLDKKSRPVRPAIVWYDNRAREEVEDFRGIITDQELYETTGISDFDPMWSANKILWVRKHEPEKFKDIDRIMLVEDFIVYMLTGIPCSSASLLATSMLVDVHKRAYWDKIVEFLDVRDKLTEIIEEGSIVGRVRGEISDDLGISRDTVVVKGSMDQNTSAIGAGNIKTGIITEATGSALAIAITVEKGGLIKGVKLPYQPHAIPGKFLYIPFAQTAGIAYKWFRDSFAGEELKRSGDPQLVYDEMNKLASSVEAGCDGLIFLPYLAGASFPENDSFAKGVFYGITLKHSRAHFTRAIIESIAFMLKKILTLVEVSGIRIDEVHSMGGGARSDLWLQIKADVCGYPFIRMVEEEAATLGAAILAAVSIGDYSSFDEAVKAMVKKGKRFLPERAHRDIYIKNYNLYCELYDSLKPLFGKY